MIRLTHTSMVALALAAAAACAAPAPRAIVEGTDSCGYCRMSISDARFGAQVVMHTGKIHVFDAVECLASFVDAMPSDARVAGVYVSDFLAPGTFVRADSARFVIDGRIESPMGRRVVAFAPTAVASVLEAEYAGTVLEWDAVRARLAETAAAHAAEHHAPGDSAQVRH